MGLQSGAVSNQHALNPLQLGTGQGEVPGCSTCTFRAMQSQTARWPLSWPFWDPL